MKFFTLQELTNSATAKRYGIDNTPSQEVIKNLEALVDNILDPLREKWGAPIIVTSAYRCPELNKKIGGSSTSQHVSGMAADIRTVSDLPSDNYKLLHTLLDMNLPVDQVISEYPDAQGRPDWIHVSFSPRMRKQLLTCRGGKYTVGIK